MQKSLLYLRKSKLTFNNLLLALWFDVLLVRFYGSVITESSLWFGRYFLLECLVVTHYFLLALMVLSTLFLCSLCVAC